LKIFCSRLPTVKNGTGSIKFEFISKNHGMTKYRRKLMGQEGNINELGIIYPNEVK
jgi:hypothetical protein